MLFWVITARVAFFMLANCSVSDYHFVGWLDCKVDSIACTDTQPIVVAEFTDMKWDTVIYSPPNRYSLARITQRVKAVDWFKYGNICFRISSWNHSFISFVQIHISIIVQPGREFARVNIVDSVFHVQWQDYMWPSHYLNGRSCSS